MSNGKFIGGVSPSVDDIKTEPELALIFMESLFGHQSNLEKKVMKLLTGSLLRFYNNFLVLLSKDPMGKFQEPRNHIVVHKIEKIKKDCQISDSLFETWQEEISYNFIRANFMALPESNVGDDVMVDGRCVVSFLKDVQKDSRANYSMLRAYEEKINMLEKLVIESDVRAENRAAESEIKAVEREHRSIER